MRPSPGAFWIETGMGRLFLFRYLSPVWLRLYGRLMADSRTPLWAKALTVAGLAYVVSPLDLVPDWLIGLGWLDDAAVVGLSLYSLVRSVPPRVREELLRDNR